MELQFVLYEKKDKTVFITINLPEKRNPVNRDVVRELSLCLDEAADDNDIRVVVLRGAGGHFCGGGDITAMKGYLASPKVDMTTGTRAAGVLALKIRKFKKPVIAWIEGSVAGGGLGLALACDFSLVEESAKVICAWVNVGLVPDLGAGLWVTKAVGAAHATDLFMTGRPITGAEAAACGLMTKALHKEELEGAVMKLVKKLAAGPSKSYSLIKEMVNRAAYREMADNLETEVEFQQICGLTHDFRESVTAFLEKRPPQCKGC